MSAHYVGKDLVHYGSGIVLDPERAHRDLDHSARKNIRRAEKAGFNIKRCRGSAEELNQLRELWYYPEDPNFPVELAEEEILYLAYLGDELVGGMVLVPVGSHLFLNNLTASDKGKREQLQGYLLWHAVNDLSGSEYTYIDIGVSYRINLQRFFTKWYPFRLFHVGAAAFIDVGRTWGSSSIDNTNLGWLSDAGVGLRLGADRSGLGNVIHVDLAFPLERREGLDNVQFLVSTKKSF